MGSGWRSMGLGAAFAEGEAALGEADRRAATPLGDVAVRPPPPPGGEPLADASGRAPPAAARSAAPRLPAGNAGAACLNLGLGSPSTAPQHCGWHSPRRRARFALGRVLGVVASREATRSAGTGDGC